MTAGPFLLERITKQFWAGYEKWICKFVKPELRLRIGISLAAFGLFVASFMAFNDEREQIIQLEASLISHGLKPPAQYALLEKQVVTAITDNFRALPKTETFVAVVLPDPSAARVAKQISDAFVGAGFSSSVTIGWLTEDNERGIKMQVHNPTQPSPQAQIYIDALRKSGLSFEVEDMSDEAAFQPFVFSIFVGPRQ